MKNNSSRSKLSFSKFSKEINFIDQKLVKTLPNADNVQKISMPTHIKSELPKNYTKNDESSKFLDYDQNMTIAYLARKFPESFNISLRIISEIKKKFCDFKPKSFLDFGAGLTPSSWAINLSYENLEKIVCVEPNPYMIKLGKYLTQDIENILWLESLNITTGLYVQKFDIVMCSFVLEEAKSPQTREIIVRSLYDKVEENGFLIFVLPGSPMGFRFLTDLRKLFISKPREECNIVAPCPHHLECPLERKQDNWCRFEQIFPRYTKDVLPKIASEKTQIKTRFCYLVIKKEPKLEDISENKFLQNPTVSWPRIITPLKRRGGHSVLYLCNSLGKYEERTVRRSEGDKLWFKCSKRLKWGDQWWYPLLPKKKYLRDQFKEWMKKK